MRPNRERPSLYRVGPNSSYTFLYEQSFSTCKAVEIGLTQPKSHGYELAHNSRKTEQTDLSMQYDVLRPGFGGLWNWRVEYSHLSNGLRTSAETPIMHWLCLLLPLPELTKTTSRSMLTPWSRFSNSCSVNGNHRRDTKIIGEGQALVYNETNPTTITRVLVALEADGSSDK